VTARSEASVRFVQRGGPDGLHLFDRTTGLNVLLDEIVVPADEWASAPRQVSVALTNACDLACSYCYAPKWSAVLGADVVASWAVELASAGCLGIGFGGGEPLLYRHLTRVCREITCETPLAVTLTTHGHRWSPRLVEDLMDSVHFVRVSVDGVDSTYERLRRRPFAQLRDRLGLIGASFPFGLNCVVNSDTVGELDRVADLAATVGASELLLLPQRAVGIRSGASTEVRHMLHAWVAGYRGPVPLAYGGAETDVLPVADPLPAEGGLRSYAHVDASGTLRRSSYSDLGVAVDDRGILAALGRLEDMDPVPPATATGSAVIVDVSVPRTCAADREGV
jgi:hypothetical protein